MAQRINAVKKPAVNISVKYTVLQRRHGIWLPISQYYQFSLRECRKLAPGRGPAAKDRYECPACLRTYTALALPEHRCAGGSADHPKINYQALKTNQRWRPTAAWPPILFEELT